MPVVTRKRHAAQVQQGLQANSGTERRGRVRRSIRQPQRRGRSGSGRGEDMELSQEAQVPTRPITRRGRARHTGITRDVEHEVPETFNPQSPEQDEGIGGGDSTREDEIDNQTRVGRETEHDDELTNGVVTKLMAVVDEYRRNTISKVDAIIAIGAAIPIEDRTSNEFLSPYRTFVEQLEQIDAHRSDAIQRAHPTEGRLPDTTLGETSGLQTAQSTKARDDLIASIAAIDPELANDPSMVWNCTVGEDLSNLSPSLQRTMRLLRIHRANYKAFVQIAMSRGNLPQIPNNEWIKIVRGEPIDYDEIYKQLDSHFIIQKKQIDLGNNVLINIANETELIATKKGGKKEINSATAWMRVHSLVSRGIVLLFAHREDELRKYGDHILSLFYNQNDPQLVVHYDRAVRNKYAQENAFDLDNTGAYFTTWQSYFTPTGTAYGELTTRGRKGISSSASGLGPGVGEISMQICNNWNEGKCRRNNCKRQHVCNVPNCGKSHKSSEHSSKS
jgi:hypothetical protein